MAMTTAQLTIIKNEIANDPLSVGYAAMGGDDNAVAASLNQPREGDPTHTLRRRAVEAYEIMSRLNYVEVQALQAAERTALTILLMSPQIDMSADNVRNAFVRWFTQTGAGSTRQMLAAYQDRPASRLEILLGENMYITHAEVAWARRV